MRSRLLSNLWSDSGFSLVPRQRKNTDMGPVFFLVVSPREESVTDDFLLKISATPPRSPSLAPAFDSCVALLRNASCQFNASPREESNLYYKIRNLASYPLNDEGFCFPV